MKIVCSLQFLVFSKNITIRARWRIATPDSDAACRRDKLRMMLRPCAVRHKFRDDVIIRGGSPTRRPLRNCRQAILIFYTIVEAHIIGHKRGVSLTARRGSRVANPRESCA